MATSKRGQAAHGIEQIFKLIKNKCIKVTLLQRFEQYLNRHHKLKEFDNEQLSKNARLFRLQKNLIDLSPETFDIVYRWIKDFSEKLSILMKEIRAINNIVLEFALTEVFKHQRIHRPLCDENKFDQLLAARFLRIANKKRTGVYASLEVLLEESVEEIKTKCIEYLKRKPKPFPLDLGQVKSILKENKTIDSHISDLESSDEGDPFIFYAAAIVYQHHINVLCAAEEGLEEYVFYPSELPSERESCDHKFIGHLSENNYFSLESTELKFIRRSELEKMAEKYQTEIETKEENIKKNEKENLKLRKEIEKNKEENLKLRKEMEKSKEIEKGNEENHNLSIEMEKSRELNLKLCRKIKKKKEENLKLRKEIETHKQRIEDLEEKIQEMDSKNTIQFQLLNDKMDKLLFNISDSTNSKKAIDDGKSKEENKSAQVANSAQNNEDRDEPTNITANIGKGVISGPAGKIKPTPNNEHNSAEKPKQSQNNEHDSAVKPKPTQNNKHRDEPNNVITAIGEGLILVSAEKAKHSAKGEHIDRPKGVRTGIRKPSLTPVLMTQDRWILTGPPKN